MSQDRIKQLEEDLVNVIAGKVKDLNDLKSLNRDMVEKLMELELPFHILPDAHLTKDDYHKEVEKNSRAISLVPPEHLTPELCEKVLRENGMLVGAIDENYLDEKLCEVAIEQNASAIWTIPERLQTRGLCKKAIEGGAEIEHIPMHFQEEMEEYKASLAK